MFKYWLYRFGQFCVRGLSERAAYRFGTFLSDIQYHFSFRDRKIVMNNLRCFVQDEADIPQMAKEVFRNFGKYLVEFFRMARDLDEQFIKDRIHLVNLHFLDEALKKGNGAIVTTAHIGNWEMGGVLLGALGYPFYAIALPHKERDVNNLFNKQREAKGVVVVPSNVAVRRSIKALQDNSVLAVVSDRDFYANGQLMDFLGKKALIPKGAAIFSYKTGAPVIPTFLIRENGNKFSFILEDPIYPPDDSQKKDEQKEILDIMKKQVEGIERTIRQYPAQWLMFRQFWVD